MRWFVFALLGALLPWSARAELPFPTVRAHATRLATNVTIDGDLREGPWTTATKQTGFIQRFPKDGAKADSETSFAILYDDDAIYVGVWCRDPEPEKVRALLTRRDNDSIADVVAIGIDSYHDRRTGYVFQLNAAGVQKDSQVSDDIVDDVTWDAVWTGGASITAEGWTAEFRIPLSQLRFPAGASQEWGFQVVRFVGRTTEQSTWSRWPQTAEQIVSKFGIVDGIDGLRPSRRIELRPYISGGFEAIAVDPADPLNDALGTRANLGLDFKYGLGPAFTISGALNPDFGQVEADASQVNLSANELFFPEKRPFFLEGADLFKLPLGVSSDAVEGGFYSRRIGAAPAPPDASYDYIDAPLEQRIYAAAKLSGKTRDAWSIGVFDAITGQESATLAEGMDRRAVVVAPLTNYAVARVKRDLRDGNTTIAGSLTSVNRALDGTPLESSLHDQAYTVGSQITHRWDRNAWTADLSVLGSWVHGSPAAIEKTQRLNRHLFQRPDATHLRVDPRRTSLPGFGLTGSIGQFGDTPHWRYGTGLELRSPGLELNDLGFQTHSDKILQFLWMEHHDNNAGPYVLNWQANHDVYYVTNFEPTLLGWGYECNASTQLVNYWSFAAGCNLNFNRWSPGSLRGGPALRVPNDYNGWVNVSTDSRSKISLSLNANGNWSPVGRSIGGGVDLGATIQAASNVDVFVGPSWSSRRDALQYIEETQDPVGLPHFVFGTIDQTTVAMTIRVNWTFSPRLALQAYAQPFIASGRYSQYKDVDAPRAERFEDRFHTFTGSEYRSVDGAIAVDRDRDGMTDFSFGKPDFDFRQLRSTIVLRWEYRPGSNVYAIWSHGRTSVVDDGRFALGRDLDGLSRADGENIVMVKLNYWIGL